MVYSSSLPPVTFLLAILSTSYETSLNCLLWRALNTSVGWTLRH